jgi:DNA modification methylase
MSETFLEGRVMMLCGDVRAMLATIPENSIDCVVTSPPYWGLRDYGVVGQIGLEPTLGEHLAVMVEVFAAVHRVLKPTGTLFLNYGDCYATSPNGRSAADTKTAGNDDRTFRDKPFSTIGAVGDGGVLKAKDLCLVPNRLAQALQAPRYTGNIKSELDRVWLAAIIDGEGSIYIHRQPIGSVTGRGRRSVRTQDGFCVGIAISNCSEAIVARAAAICGKENVRMTKANGTSNRRDHYDWRVTGNIAKNILREIYPYLVAKQREARVAIACPPSGNIATATWIALKSLHKGRPTDFDAKPPLLSDLWQQGWWVRSEIIWGKRNGMPDSSGKYRPSTAHEKIFMLTKSADCFYDAAAVAMPAGGNTNARAAQKIKVPGAWDLGPGGHGTINRDGRTAATYRDNPKSWKGSSFGDARDIERHPDSGWRGKPGVTPKSAPKDSNIRANVSFHASTTEVLETRYLRNYEPAPLEVWPMATHAFSEVHFATFPPELVERAIKAGCPAGGSVLDPFGGSGTTAMVAVALGRAATLIELNPEYCTLARARIEAAFMGKGEGARHMAKSMGRALSPGPLFDGL